MLQSKNNRQSVSFFLVLVIGLMFSAGAVAQKQSSGNEMLEIENLLDNAFPMVSEKVKKSSDYFLCAAALKNDGSISIFNSGVEGDPAQHDDVDSVKSELTAGAKKGAYKAVVMFYKVRTINPQTKQTTDAIAAYTEHRLGKGGYVFYYPFNVAEGSQLSNNNSFGSAGVREIFGAN